MNGPDAFFGWALETLARLHSQDPGAAVFRAPYDAAQALPPAAKEWVHALPATPSPPERLLPEFAHLFGRHVANARSPQFQNQLFSGVLPEAMAGYLLGVFSHVTISTREVAPLADEIERAVTAWLLALLPWDQETGGATATPSGSFSNYLAVYLARKRAEATHGANVIPRLAVITSEAAHYSIEKGADLAGVPRENVLRVATDEGDHLGVDGVAAAIEAARERGLVPFLVSATLGTTVSGAADPIEAIAPIASGADCWLHADAAWGGLLFCGSEAGRMTAGLELADSVTWDAHKAAASPLALSFLLVRERTALLDLRPSHGGGYLFQHTDEQDADDADLGLTSLYCGKPFHSLGLWLLWKARGAAGMRDHADRAWTLAQRFANAITGSPHYDLVQEPETASVCFRPVAPEGATAADRHRLAEEVRARIIADGEWLIRLCPLRGEQVFRALFVNPYADVDYVERLVRHLEASAEG